MFLQGLVVLQTCLLTHIQILKFTSHEIRINADINDRTSVTAGVFMSDTDTYRIKPVYLSRFSR